MNLKLIYGLIYGFFGFIVAALFSAAFYAIVTVLLWTFFLGANGSWPPWLLLVLAVAFIILFLYVNIKLISAGMKKGAMLEAEDEEYKEENYHRAKLLLRISILSLLVFIVFLTFKFGKFYDQRLADQTQSQRVHPKISSLILRQNEKILEVVVGINGLSEEPYEIAMEVIAVGNRDQQIVSVVQDVTLSYSYQEFVFPISFDSLGERFHAFFTQYVPATDQKIGVDALLKVVAHLNLKKIDAEAQGTTAAKDSIEVGRQETMAKFFFSCMNSLCIVSQFDSQENIPTEKFKKNLPRE